MKEDQNSIARNDQEEQSFIEQKIYLFRINKLSKKKKTILFLITSMIMIIMTSYFIIYSIKTAKKLKIIQNANIYLSNKFSIGYKNNIIKEPEFSIFKNMLPRLSPDLKIYPSSIEEIFNARQIYISDSKITRDYISYIRYINETEEEKYKKRYSENETIIDQNIFKKRENQYDYRFFAKLALDEILLYDHKIKYENKPNISVIVPSYNKQDILLKSIRSIQNQNFQNIEIIIVNDCSNDNSTEVFNYLLNTDPRIRIIHHKTNLGLWRTHLDGILYSKGQYIILFDAGDLYEDNYVLTDAYNVVEKYNLDSCKFIFRIIRSFKGLNKSEEYFHVENNETIAYGPDKVRKLNRKIFTFWGNIWTRLIRANILIKGILLMNDLTLNLHKNLWDDIWLNKIVNMASFSFAVLGRTGYVYLQNGGGEGSPKSGSIEQKSKKVKEYVGFLYFEYNFRERKNSIKYIINKLKQYNETDPILRLQNFINHFEVLNNLLNALIADPELNIEQKTFCQQLLEESLMREKNCTNATL